MLSDYEDIHSLKIEYVTHEQLNSLFEHFLRIKLKCFDIRLVFKLFSLSLFEFLLEKEDEQI